jgi:hypothetical protein
MTCHLMGYKNYFGDDMGATLLLLCPVGGDVNNVSDMFVYRYERNRAGNVSYIRDMKKRTYAGEKPIVKMNLTISAGGMFHFTPIKRGQTPKYENFNINDDNYLLLCHPSRCLYNNDLDWITPRDYTSRVRRIAGVEMEFFN